MPLSSKITSSQTASSKIAPTNMNSGQSLPLDLFTLPLTGRSLIEASAGTGKTYSLAFIYLRLLLGIGDNCYPKPLTVDQILVVTFTKAATEELRYRIRQNIHQLRIACLRGFHEDADYQALIDLIDNKEMALERLLFAEQHMDEAAIFTIHGFCQRVLTTYAFESGILFEQALVKDETRLYLQIVQDFWRQYFTPLPQQLASIIWQYWADPEALLKDIWSFLSNELPVNILPTQPDVSQTILSFHEKAILQIQTIKQKWLESCGEVESIISQSGVNKRSYSKSSLPKWLNSVSEWAKSPTIDYSIAPELEKFSQQVLDSKTEDDKQAPTHKIFSDIDKLLSNSFSLRDNILFDIVRCIKQQIQHEKSRLAQMGFDDLLSNLHYALQGGNGDYLAKIIASQYPVAMIDEFQDTDPIQYQIFDRIYNDREQTGLLLIGDPKQAIYGFRGADIFTYIKAKDSVDHQYTMATNWRSSLKMVQAVNSVFSQHKQPFIFDAIPFLNMQAAPRNCNKGFYFNDQEVAALSCHLLPETITSATDYAQLSAKHCADQIAGWLAGDSYFNDGRGNRKKVTSADIAILVRVGREADIIQQELAYRGVKSVYVSNHKSVFDSIEAREILRILQAVLMPAQDRYLRSALATQLIGTTMADIEAFSDDQSLWEKVVDEFLEYQYYWLNYGVLVMLRRLMAQRNIAENALSLADGERVLTNFMHLGELLQEVSQELDTPHALLRWLTTQINQPDLNIENHEQRLESDENLVQIVTIHKSKGLEYPIVCLPFIGDYRKADGHIYHDRKTYSPHYAFERNESINELIEQERLAEDLRLLYVALTRSIYHCCIGLAGLKKGRSSSLSLGNAAIGYLLLANSDNSFSSLKERLLSLEQTRVIDVEISDRLTVLPSKQPNLSRLQANQFSRKLDSYWRVTSYSGLQQSSHGANSTTVSTSASIYETLPSFDIDALADVSTNRQGDALYGEGKAGEQKNETSCYTIHAFPKGAFVGTLLHECFEKIDFEQPQINELALNVINKLNLDEAWRDILIDWFNSILSVPLNEQGLTLEQIKREQRLDELEFYLPIINRITANELDHICKAYDPLSKQCESLSFATVQGMLKGFIDMVFEWQGKYYLLDYKSNWLGHSADAYTQEAIKQAICEHRYDLQYQLYSLALHRYLKNRIVDYQYESHFGGVYYLFLRGMEKSLPNNGVFYHRSQQTFIDELDQLFG